MVKILEMRSLLSMANKLTMHLKLTIKRTLKSPWRRIFLLTIPGKILNHRRSNYLTLVISLWFIIKKHSKQDTNRRLSRKKSMLSRKGSTTFRLFLIQMISSIQIFKTFEQTIFSLRSSDKNRRILISFSTTKTSINFIWRRLQDTKVF